MVEKESERERERECVWVCERERESESEIECGSIEYLVSLNRNATWDATTTTTTLSIKDLLPGFQTWVHALNNTILTK
jgi:hypothetical protein